MSKLSLAIAEAGMQIGAGNLAKGGIALVKASQILEAAPRQKPQGMDGNGPVVQGGEPPPYIFEVNWAGLRKLPYDKRLEVLDEMARKLHVADLDGQGPTTIAQQLAIERHRALSTALLLKNPKIFTFEGDGWDGDKLAVTATWSPRGSSRGPHEVVITQVVHPATGASAIVGHEMGKNPRSIAWSDLVTREG